MKFTYCAMAYPIAWTLMKWLVPRHAAINVLWSLVERCLLLHIYLTIPSGIRQRCGRPWRLHLALAGFVPKQRTDPGFGDEVFLNDFFVPWSVSMRWDPFSWVKLNRVYEGVNLNTSKHRPMTEQSIEGNLRKMVRVQGGDFLMGATPEQETEALDSEKPVHPAAVGDFMICRYPVTQGEWEAVMGGNPSDFKGDPSLPVETVSHDDAIAFINRMNAMTNHGFRLPTEADWEYAALGGPLSKGFRYSGGNDTDEVAWTSRNSGGRTHPVGLLKPNELDLYDMSGNVWEWCMDPWWEYGTQPSPNPQIRPYPNHRVSRGGSWIGGPMYACVSSRSGDSRSHWAHHSGFRLAMSLAWSPPHSVGVSAYCLLLFWR
jgi:formylglycine-generating enzyme required for sulfatase activity